MWRLNPLAPRGPEDGWEEVSLWGMGIASGDVDGNGFPDVMLTSMGDQLLQFNDGASFENAPYSIGSYAQRPHAGDDGRPSTGWHAEFGDVDNDGRLDLFIAKGNVDQMPSNAMHDPNSLLMQKPDGTFEEASVAAGIATMDRSRGAALSDLDGDGRLDLVVVNRRAPMEIWQNVTEGTGHWLAVDLRQRAPNTRAVGAWIEVRAGDKCRRTRSPWAGGMPGEQAGAGPCGPRRGRSSGDPRALAGWRLERMAPDRSGPAGNCRARRHIALLIAQAARSTFSGRRAIRSERFQGYRAGHRAPRGR